MAPELPAELLPTALQAVVALYLYATLVSEIRGYARRVKRGSD